MESFGRGFLLVTASLCLHNKRSLLVSTSKETWWCLHFVSSHSKIQRFPTVPDDEFDEDAEQEAGDENVQAIMDKVVREKSRLVYCGKLGPFFYFLHQREDHGGLSFGFLVDYPSNDEKLAIRYGKMYVKERRSPSPICWNDFDFENVLRWLQGLRKKDGSKPGKST